MPPDRVSTVPAPGRGVPQAEAGVLCHADPRPGAGRADGDGGLICVCRSGAESVNASGVGGDGSANGHDDFDDCDGLRCQRAMVIEALLRCSVMLGCSQVRSRWLLEVRLEKPSFCNLITVGSFHSP